MKIEQDWELYNSPFGTTNVGDVQNRLAASQPYMKPLVKEFSDVFSEQPGKTSTIEFEIELKDSTKSIQGPVYAAPGNVRNQL
ncbi:hypothetical protein A3Q56_08426, partial [Intoshia linei]